MRLKPMLFSAVILLGIGLLLWQAYPLLLFKVSEWQRSFNLELSASLNGLHQQQQAGLSLVLVSFLYGVFHAVGPGHGKFLLTGYLSFEQTKLPQAIKLTLAAAFVQGIVAVVLVSVIVVLFTLSRHYFNLTLKWVERGSFVLMMLFGIYWIYQSRRLFKRTDKRAKAPKILQISRAAQPLSHLNRTTHQHTAHCDTVNCGCGHTHLPSANAMAQAKDWKSQAMLIFSIGLRPCSGAILVLFLAYTLDLYLWGVLSALVMALGTGLSLSLFALLVLVARQKALNLGRWYLSIPSSEKAGLWLKLLVGSAMILFAVTLLHSSWLDNSQNLLFKR